MYLRAICCGFLCLGILAPMPAARAQSGESVLHKIPAEVTSFAYLNVEATRNSGIDAYFTRMKDADSAWHWLRERSRQVLGISPEELSAVTAFDFVGNESAPVLIIEGELQPETTLEYVQRQLGYEQNELHGRVVHSWQPLASIESLHLHGAFFTDRCLVLSPKLDGVRKSLAVLDGRAASLAEETPELPTDCLFVLRARQQNGDPSEPGPLGKSAVEVRQQGESIVVSVSIVFPKESSAQGMEEKWAALCSAVRKKARDDAPIRRLVESSSLVVIGHTAEFRLALPKQSLNTDWELDFTSVLSLTGELRTIFARDLLQLFPALTSPEQSPTDGPSAAAEAAAQPAERSASRLPPDPFESR